MDKSVFIALINPGMSLVFSAAFFVLWKQQRHRRYIAILCVGFVALAFAFLMQYFAVPFGASVARFCSNTLFVLASITLSVGCLERYRRKPPYRALFLIALPALAMFSWFLYVDPDITWRIYIVNFAFGGICLVLAAEIRAVANRKPIDNLLIGVIAFWALTFFPRPLITTWLEPSYLSYEHFYESLYWITLTSSAALFLLTFALSLVTAIAIDLLDELRRESLTDPLSGLLNRRGFEEGALEAISHARRKHMPVALVACDLDHFKSINDTYGHACGDKVIATFAECIRATLRNQHLVGRVGGEEFAILMSGANVSTARLFSEGVRAAFATLSIPGLPPDLRFTASFGVAELMATENLAHLSARADRALYEAKKAGRDRVRVSAGELSGGQSAPEAEVEADRA
ncbi:GGDEF domain-containing protein [Aquamicrobium sp. LC103]|uniref:GGDEF domain-containing protein n=1 Tax=Aquamicrobium sp. LC103 TaxID=1120658 RepID=UPI000A61E1EE|nr:GGDEF domain-containing protein [Aquamicrobium sp. LC103]TKT82840.1 GGDEF domain-containing protein [Aquamicrobium sp. LC103]